MSLDDFQLYFSSGFCLLLAIGILVDKFFFKSRIANLSYKSMKYLIAILAVIFIISYVYLRLNLVH
ncbi:hypothetical protein C7375_11185 [Frischella perrara]|uniref:Uncharacterized protein n=1 Tax=Frischella perrara TaxID=1267021 RepID=A0A0A7S3R5_FRIPE|nr:hypothetical protein FPB0191_01651 [Frischella perrara]PWV59985.1 hypothetical protein C7375_11185 [Frischella perrara]